MHAGQSAAPPRSHCARARGRAGPGSGRTPHRPAGGPRPASTTVVAVSPAVGRLRTGRVGADSDTSRHCRGPLRRLPSRNPAGTVVLVILEFSSQKFFGFRFRSIPQAGLGSFHLWIRVSSLCLEPHIPTVYLSSTSIFASLASSLLRICSIRSAILQFLLSARLLSSPSRGRRFVDGSSSPLSLPPGIGPFLAARQSHVNLNQACPVWGTFHLHGRRSG